MMRLAKILIGATLAATAAYALPAAAGSWRDMAGGRFDVQAQRERPGGFQRAPRREFGRAARPPEREPRRDGRLTEEERRELRRDLDRANREIYKGQRR